MKKFLSLIVTVLLIFSLVGCENSKTADAIQEEIAGIAQLSGFAYSKPFDDKGFIRNVKADKLIPELFDYKALAIAKSDIAVSEGAIQEQIDLMCSYFGLTTEVTDRPIEDGDKVNIDYIGTTVDDNEEFEGGNTQGDGTFVTAGSEEYIDDFLTQIIGHTPGETFDIYVTFPDDSGDLTGREVKFVTTINYIEGSKELTDEDVEANLFESNGWKTVADAEKGIRENLEKTALYTHVVEYMIKYAQSKVKLDQLPKDYLTYYDDVTLAYFQDTAARYSMSLTDYLVTYVQVGNTEELLAKFKETNDKEAVSSILMQAIADDAKIRVDDADIRVYLQEAVGNDVDVEETLKEYKDQFGMPYVYHIVLQDKVIKYVVENAVVS